MAAEVLEAVPDVAASLPNPVDGSGRIRAILFDLDGTLYNQRAMRALMSLELAALASRSPRRAVSTIKALSAYRHAQEQLRSCRTASFDAKTQCDAAARATGLDPAQIGEVVELWMQQRPLKYMRWCRATGLLALLAFLERRGIPAGLLSDYPAADKLRALGLNGRFSIVLSAADADVGALKPSPAGFLAASARWRLEPADVLVVGDRVDVDAAGAAAAGMSCVIVGPDRRAVDRSGRTLGMRTLRALHATLAAPEQAEHSRRARK